MHAEIQKAAGGSRLVPKAEEATAEIDLLEVKKEIEEERLNAVLQRFGVDEPEPAVAQSDPYMLPMQRAWD